MPISDRKIEVLFTSEGTYTPSGVETSVRGWIKVPLWGTEDPFEHLDIKLGPPPLGALRGSLFALQPLAAVVISSGKPPGQSLPLTAAALGVGLATGAAVRDLRGGRSGR